jgi:hypothetical protein
MIRSPLFQKSQSMSSRLKRYSKVVAHGLVHSAARAMLGLAELQTALAPRATDCERTAKARGVIFTFRRHSSNRSSISGSYPLAGIDSGLQLAPARSNSESSADTCSGVSTADCSCLGTMLLPQTPIPAQTGDGTEELCRILDVNENSGQVTPARGPD